MHDGEEYWFGCIKLLGLVQEMRSQTQDFATSLLDHARTSNELEIMLNYEPESTDPWEIGERQSLDRLKLAIKYKQKKV